MYTFQFYGAYSNKTACGQVKAIVQRCSVEVAWKLLHCLAAHGYMTYKMWILTIVIYVTLHCWLHLCLMTAILHSWLETLEKAQHQLAINSTVNLWSGQLNASSKINTLFVYLESFVHSKNKSLYYSLQFV